MESSSKPTRLWGMYSSLAVVACTAFPCISCCRSGVLIREFLSDSGRFTVCTGEIKRISGAPCKSAAHPCKTWSFQPCSNNLATEGGPKLDLFLTRHDANPVGLDLTVNCPYQHVQYDMISHLNMLSSRIKRLYMHTCNLQLQEFGTNELGWLVSTFECSSSLPQLYAPCATQGATFMIIMMSFCRGSSSLAIQRMSIVMMYHQYN